MRRIALVALLFVLANDALGGYSSPSRGGSSYSSPSRSYSAPSRSYSAPARSYSAPKASPAPAPAPPPVVYHTTVVHQSVGGDSGGGFGLFHWMALNQLMQNNTPDPPGAICTGGGCSKRTCQQVAPH